MFSWFAILVFFARGIIVDDECVESHTVDGYTKIESANELPRYCEIWVGYPQDDGSILYDIWYSGDTTEQIDGVDITAEDYEGGCPASKFDTITPESVMEDFPGSTDVYMNGPRHEVVNGSLLAPLDQSLEEYHEDDEAYFLRFGDLLMMKFAQIGETPQFFDPMEVERDFGYYYGKDMRVSELIDPEGVIYIMQSYASYESEYVDELNDWDDLPDIGDTMGLPEGWTYRTRILKKEFDLHPVDNIAVIFYDFYYNAYALRTDCQITSSDDGVKIEEQDSAVSTWVVVAILLVSLLSAVALYKVSKSMLWKGRYEIHNEVEI